AQSGPNLHRQHPVCPGARRLATQIPDESLRQVRPTFFSCRRLGPVATNNPPPTQHRRLLLSLNLNLASSPSDSIPLADESRVCEVIDDTRARWLARRDWRQSDI